MNFSPEWEQLYSSNNHLSIWPWSDLVSYVMRYCRNITPSFKVLELGCGAGANISFFKKLGVQYYSIEGSKFIVDKLRAQYPEYDIVTGDFTKEIPFNEQFDLVVDRASLTHNTGSIISDCITMVRDKIVPGGKFIGIDWFSTLHSDFQLGEYGGDENTKTNIRTGQFNGVGRVHFSDKDHIVKLFQEFEITQMEHKINKTLIPNTEHVFASWNFVAVKK